MRKPEENKHREHFVPVGKQHVHECACGYRKHGRGSERVIFLWFFPMLFVLLGGSSPTPGSNDFEPVGRKTTFRLDRVLFLLYSK